MSKVVASFFNQHLCSALIDCVLKGLLNPLVVINIPELNNIPKHVYYWLITKCSLSTARVLWIG